MDERIAIARSGARTVFLGSFALHSTYNPEIEAERYLAELHIDPSTPFVILIEPCLGYLVKHIRTQFPSIRILSLHCSSFYSASKVLGTSDATWYADSSIGLISFLEQHITDAEAGLGRLIQWAPACSAYKTCTTQILKTCNEFIQRSVANKRTLQTFGKRWLRNTFRLLDSIQRPSILEAGEAPLIVAASGPSLEQACPLLAQSQKNTSSVLIAVSSAVPVLLAHGVKVDLVVASDGGSWARYHLFETHRAKLPLAASMTAAIPSSCASEPLIILSEGKKWQNLILENLSLAAFVSPQRGTVAATALDLALASTKNEIYLAGFDFSHRDLASHARPYALDRFREDAASRLEPEYSYAFNRTHTLDNKSSFNIYAAWFSGRAKNLEGRVHAIHSIHPSFPVRSICESIKKGSSVLPKLSIGTLNTEKASMRSSEKAFIALMAALQTEDEGGELVWELSELLACPAQAILLSNKLAEVYESYRKRLYDPC
ncbi:hypothetical protein MASR2M78_01480 [Treponema sp.]